MSEVKECASFFNTEKIKELLKSTCAGDPLAESMFQTGHRSLYERIQVELVSSEIEGRQLLFLLKDTMAEYIAAHHSSQVFKQRLWDTAVRWLDRIANRLGENFQAADFENICPKPISEDRCAALVKALHDSSGKSKEDLAADLGVTPRMIQTNLRSLCPQLCEDGQTAQIIRFAGQQVNVRVEWKDGEHGRRFYHTPDRLHPVSLQLNTMQAGILLHALQQYYEQHDSFVSKSVAGDVWWQLSDIGKDRLQEVFGANDAALQGFLDDLKNESDGEVHQVFRTEAEMADWISSAKEQLMVAFKGGHICNFSVADGDEKRHFTHHKIRMVDHDVWGAYPADAEDAQMDGEPFRTDMLQGWINIVK